MLSHSRVVGLGFSKAAFLHRSVTAMTSSFHVPAKADQAPEEQRAWLPFPDFQGIHPLSPDSGRPSKLVELNCSRKFRIREVPQFPVGGLQSKGCRAGCSVASPKKARQSNRRPFQPGCFIKIKVERQQGCSGNLGNIPTVKLTDCAC